MLNKQAEGSISITKKNNQNYLDHVPESAANSTGVREH